MNKRKQSPTIIEKLEPALKKTMKLNIKYKKLQRYARKHGIKANLGRKKIIEELQKKGVTLQKGTEPQKSKVIKNTKLLKQTNLEGKVITSGDKDNILEEDSENSGDCSKIFEEDSEEC